MDECQILVVDEINSNIIISSKYIAKRQNLRENNIS